MTTEEILEKEMLKMREKENFFRICTAIVDYGKDALVMLLQYYLEIDNESFEQFITRNQHKIYHLCYNKKPCCQCGIREVLPGHRVLHHAQLGILLDTTQKFPGCKVGGTAKCCYQTKQGLTFKELDVTLLCCLLFNFVPAYRTQIHVERAVDDIKEYRNTLYGHAKSAEIDAAKYEKDIKDVTDALLKIAGFCGKKTKHIMEGKINTLETLPYREDLVKSFRAKLKKEQIKQIDHCSKVLKGLKRTRNEVSTTVEETEKRLTQKVEKAVQESSEKTVAGVISLLDEPEQEPQMVKKIKQSFDQVDKNLEAIKSSVGRIQSENRELTKIIYQRAESAEEEKAGSSVLKSVGLFVGGALAGLVSYQAYNYCSKPSTSNNNRS